MARKNLLKDLLADPLPASDAPAPAPSRPSGGAIGAVSRGIADLKARAVLDLDPFLIDAGGVTDRLEHDEADHARLMASLRDHGQQVPVLVRPHPEAPGRYQIVYGRRRVLALRDLGQPGRALVRDLDDLAPLMAQGQENTARRDLSFIEKANFARQMTEAGYERRVVCDALSVDKTLLSWMLSVTDRVPVAVIELVGAAPGIGRERWLAFAALVATHSLDHETSRDILAVSPVAPTADSRFEILEAWLRGQKLTAVNPPPPANAAARETLRTVDGHPLAELIRRGDTVTLSLRGEGPDGFGDWLATHLAQIHASWRESRDEKS